MGVTTTNVLTFEEFERLPEYTGKQELLKGELIEFPPADFVHGMISHRIYDAVRAALDAAHARGEAVEPGATYHEMGYKLTSDSYVQPDVSVTHAGQAVQKYLGGAPAIAIEVISPSNTAEEMDFKTKLYFEHGAREVWRFYPRTQRVVVHVPGESHEVGDNLTTPLIPGFSLPVRDVFTA